MASQRTITLRAFSIHTNNLSHSTSRLKSLLCSALNGSLAKDRGMPLNQRENEKDLIGSFKIGPQYIFGTMLRISDDGVSGQMPREMLDREMIDIEDITSEKDAGSIIYRHHYYFLINNNRIVVSSSTETTIKRMQTYLNWLLEDSRGECLFEFVPMVSREIPITTFREIKSIRFGEDFQQYAQGETEEGNEVRVKSFKDIGIDILKQLFGDSETIETIAKNNLIKAQLRISFSKKPHDMSIEDYDRSLGATINPISDVEGVQFETKTGTFISGKDIMCKKRINVDKTTTGNIVEEGLKQEMLRFLSELQ